MYEVERMATNGMDERCKQSLKEKGMPVKQRRMIVHDEDEWRAMLNK